MQQDYINNNCFQATFLLLIRLGICHLHRLDSRDQRIDSLWKFCLSQVRIFFCPSHNFSLSTTGLEFMGPPVVRTLLSYSKAGATTSHKHKVQTQMGQRAAAVTQVCQRAASRPILSVTDQVQNRIVLSTKQKTQYKIEIINNYQIPILASSTFEMSF